VQGATSSGYPVLRRILVAYGDKIGYAADVEDALANLSQTVVGITVNGTTDTGTATPTPTPTPTGSGSSPPASSSSSSPTATSGSTSATAVLQQLNAAFKALSQAYQSGDPTQIGAAQGKVAQLTQQYLNLIGTASATPTPTSS
jgi:hypothetical protein